MRQIVTPIVVIFLAALTGVASGADEFGASPTWKPAAAVEVRPAVFTWLAKQPIEPAARGELENLWPVEGDLASVDQLFERLAKTLAGASDDVRSLREVCSAPRRGVSTPEFPWLDDPKTPDLVRNNMRLYFGRWLMQEGLFDEALVVVADLDVDDVVHPALLLFCQSVIHHRLVHTERSQQATQRLLERNSELPRRYQELAKLMSGDLKTLKDDSLDHIARRMNDIHRRLDLGRAGKRVRKIEDDVIASLDKLIKKLEDQQQQQSSSSSSSGQQSSNPANESRIMTQKGPGEVQKKDIGSKSGWGDLPPKQREEALQQIGKDFPAHFRDAIEQYFRKLASEKSDLDK